MSLLRTLAVRSIMPSTDSVEILLGHIAIEKANMTYARPSTIFRKWTASCLRHKQHALAN